ncbi:MAG: class I tRNA ligase family protein, partial [Bacteroidetes bacterium]|nr:class I tRNA ligase family protein [Bacteroidota bacterium]
KGKDKIAAYQTLHECLLSISKLIAPFAPFIAEELYQIFTVDRGNSQESVHLEMLPTVQENVINPELEHKMEQAIHIVSIVRSMRMKANLKVRQPLQKIIIPVLNEAQRIEIEQIKDVILDEINVKSIEYVTDETTLIKKKAKPNFKTLGPKFGKQVQQVASRVRELTNEEIKSLQQNGSLTLTVENTTITIDPTDVEIIHEDIPGWLVETDGSFTVALDTALTPELIDEGFAREFVNRIQNLRKDNGLEVTDRIVIFHSSSDRLLQALNRMADYIKQETLALEIVSVTPQQAATMNAVEEDINGEKTAIVVQKK